MRILGIDFGFARIGLAVVDTEFRFATPKSPLAASGTLKKDAEALWGIYQREKAELAVFGLPLEQDGVEGKMARICRTVGGHLEALGAKVAFVDETLTSVTADNRLREEGLKASERRKRRDGEAACLILERYLDAQTNL